MIGKLTRTILRTFAFALALCATTSAWADPTLSYSGYVSIDANNKSAVFTGVSLSDIGTTYRLIGHIGGGSARGTKNTIATVYSSTLANGVLSVQFRVIDGVYCKAVTVDFTQGGDTIYAVAKNAVYSQVNAMDSSLRIYARLESSMTLSSSDNAAGYGVVDLALTNRAGATDSIMNDGRGFTSSTPTYAASDTYSITIPETQVLKSGDYVRVTMFAFGLNSDADTLGAYRVTSKDYRGATLQSSIVNGTGGKANAIYNDNRCKFPTVAGWKQCFAFEAEGDGSDLLLKVGQGYDFALVDSSGAAVAQKVVAFAENASATGLTSYSPVAQSTTSTTTRMEQEVFAVVLASAETAAGGNWSALGWSNAPTDWTTATSDPVLVVVTDDCEINIDTAVNIESVVFDIASGKTLTFTGSNAISASKGIVFRGGAVSVPNEGMLLGTIKIADDTVFSIGGNLDNASTVAFEVASGKTLTLSAGSLTAADTVNVTGNGAVVPTAVIVAKVDIAKGATVTANNGSTIYVSNFVGSGTIVFDGIRPSTTANDAVTICAQATGDWNGTVWIKNYGQSSSTELPTTYWGNSGSKIKWTNVCGYFPKTGEFGGEWVLDNGDASFAIKRTNGFTSGDSEKLVINKVSGTGQYFDYHTTPQVIMFKDISDFTGEIYYDSGAKLKLTVGSDTYRSTEGGMVSLCNCECNFTINNKVSASTPLKVVAAEGTVVIKKNGNFEDRLTVLSGVTLKAGCYFGDDAGTKGPFGKTCAASSVASTTRRVIAEDGATIDLNGMQDIRYFFKLSGDGTNEEGALVNKGDSFDDGKASVHGIELAADASIGGTGNFGIIAGSYNTTVLNFGANGYTLTKKGNNLVYLANATKAASSGDGKICIEDGTLRISKRDSTLSGIAVDVVGGTLDVDMDFSIGALNQTGGTIDIASGKTVTATDTTITEMSLATLAGSGTLNLSGCTAATTLNIKAGADRAKTFSGTINYPANLTTVNITLDEADAEVESSSITFDQSSYGFGEGVTVNYQVLMKSGALVPGTYDDGTITYTEPVARIGTTGYATLAAAVSGAVENDTVVLLGASSEDITLNKTINFVETATFSGSFTGNGTLIMTTLPKSLATTLWSEGWTGTLWLKDITFPTIASGDDAGKPKENPVVFGNANSTLRLTSCSGGFDDDFRYDETKHKFPGTLDLVDENDAPAFSVTSGWPKYGKTVFAKLTGTGTLTSGDPSKAHYYQFLDASEFRGTITIPSDGKFRVGIGSVDANSGNGDSIADRTLTIQTGASATIAAGKTWSAPGGIEVNGTLNCNGGKIYGTGASGTLTLGGSGLIVNTFEGGDAQCFNAGEITVSGSLQVKMVGGWSNFGTWTLTDTASLGFDPGTDDEICLNSTISAATVNNTIHIYGNGSNKVVENNPDGTKLAAISIHNGGKLQFATEVGQSDYTKWYTFGTAGAVTVNAGGEAYFYSRETYTRNTYLNGGKITLAGLEGERSFDINAGLGVNVSENSIIEATDSSRWIWLRSGTPTFTVAENKTLTVNAGFKYYISYSNNNLIKAGAGTMVVNGYVDGSGNHEPFSQPRGVTINAGTYELNAVQTSNNQTGDNANFYTVAAGAKLKIGATGQANMTTLNLVNGSLLEFGASNATLINANTVSFTSGEVAVSLSEGVTPANGTKLIGWTTAPAGGTFTLEGCPQYRVVAESDGLYLMKIPGTIFSVY